MPALGAATLFACGILLARCVSLPIGVWIAFALLFLLVAFLSFSLSEPDGQARIPSRRLVIVVLLVVALGAVRVAVEDDAQIEIPLEVLSEHVTVSGTVLDSYRESGTRTRFIVRADSLIASVCSLPLDGMRFLVTLTRQRKDSVVRALSYGQRVQLTGTAYRPPAERNPGEFNARAYYDAQGISYLMRVRGHSNLRHLEGVGENSLHDVLMRRVVLPLRSYVLRLFDETIGGEEGELLKGILIGERSGIPLSTRTAFVNSGIAHILAVSGSNVAVVYAFFMMLLGLCRVPRRSAILANVLILILYMLLTGSQPPIVRATVMAVVLLLAKLSGGKTNSLNALGSAALVILVYEPRQLFDVGFQFSFAAVLSIIYSYPQVNTLLARLSGAALWRKAVVLALQISVVTLAATLGTVPLTALYFGKVSVVGMFTNIVVLPLVGVSVSLGFASTLFGSVADTVAHAFGEINAVILRAILEIAAYSGSLPWAYVETFRFRPLHAFPFYLALLWMFHLSMKKYSRVFFLLLLCSLAVLPVAPIHPLDSLPKDRLRVSFIDVGQGDAALVEFPGGSTMLIDAGMWSEDYDAGEHIVVPFLKRRNIDTIDWFVASHPHSDHIGGSRAMFEAFSVRCVIESGQPAFDPAYSRYVKAVQDEGAAVRKARARDSVLTVGGARIYFLYPTTEALTADSSDRYKNINNTSVVLKVLYGAVSFLFVGDLEREGEAALCRMFGEFLRSDVLKVGHHGSNTSTTQEFLDLARPRYAVVSVGRNNTFNHPATEVLDRMKAMGVDVLRTDEEGAVIFESDGTTLHRLEWR